MSSDVAIRVEGLGKAYTIRHNRSDHVTLAQVALDRAKHPLQRSEREEFWALRDVSFEVRKGEVLGVIGRNGAGKSTLLKLLTRITGPSTGRIDLWGRVGSLLEVGTGFHPELTGRENVYLNGSILGMTRKEIDRQFDAIVEFAGVERFLDTPVKRYSSGMYVRLAFAVAAHLETEILLLDEVLAVGDGDFQAKCLGKVSDLATDGRTVLLVSHNMHTVRSFGHRTQLLESGELLALGSPDEVIAAYSDEVRATEPVVDLHGRPRPQPGLGEVVRLREIRLGAGSPLIAADDALGFSIVVTAAERRDHLRVGVSVRASDGVRVGTAWSSDELTIDAEATANIDLLLPSPRLAPGIYQLTLSIGIGDGRTGVQDLDLLFDAISFEVAPATTAEGLVTTWDRTWGPVRLEPPVVTAVHGSGLAN